MMAEVGKLTFSIDTEGAARSIASLTAAVHLVDGLLDRIVDAGDGAFVLGDDLSCLFRCEAVDLSAGGAGELHRLRIVPDERYIELVSAITANGDPYISGFVHDWPILSSVSGSTTIAEAEPESIPSGGGSAA